MQISSSEISLRKSADCQLQGFLPSQTQAILPETPPLLAGYESVLPQLKNNPSPLVYLSNKQPEHSIHGVHSVPTQLALLLVRSSLLRLIHLSKFGQDVKVASQDISRIHLLVVLPHFSGSSSALLELRFFDRFLACSI